MSPGGLHGNENHFDSLEEAQLLVNRRNVESYRLLPGISSLEEHHCLENDSGDNVYSNIKENLENMFLNESEFNIDSILNDKRLKQTIELDNSGFPCRNKIYLMN